MKFRNRKSALLLVFLLIGGLLFVQGLRLLEEYSIRAKLYFGDPTQPNVSTADGIIIERRVVPQTGNPDNIYATYRYGTEVSSRESTFYTDEDRIDGMYEGPIPSDALEKLSVGDRVSVNYVTDHPYISKINGSDFRHKDEYLFERVAARLLFYLGTGALFLLGAAILMFILMMETMRSWIKRDQPANVKT